MHRRGYCFDFSPGFFIIGQEVFRLLVVILPGADSFLLHLVMLLVEFTLLILAYGVSNIYLF